MLLVTSDWLKITGDKQVVTPDNWHMKHDASHMTHDPWQITLDEWIHKKRPMQSVPNFFSYVWKKREDMGRNGMKQEKNLRNGKK